MIKWRPFELFVQLHENVLFLVYQLHKCQTLILVDYIVFSYIPDIAFAKYVLMLTECFKIWSRKDLVYDKHFWFFRNRNLVCNFQTLFARKRGLAHPYFLIWKWITSTLSFILLERNDNVFSFRGSVFPRGPFFLKSRVRVRVRFWDDAQNDEQFQKLRKQGAHMAFQTGIPEVYFSVKTESHLMLEKKKKVSFKRKVGRYLSTESNMTRKKLTYDERFAHENLLIK